MVSHPVFDRLAPEMKSFCFAEEDGEIPEVRIRQGVGIPVDPPLNRKKGGLTP
jgi:hypothetical protein